MTDDDTILAGLIVGVVGILVAVGTAVYFGVGQPQSTSPYVKVVNLQLTTPASQPLNTPFGFVGYVLDQHGNPLSPQPVIAIMSNGAQISEITIATNGDYTFEYNPPGGVGTYVVQVFCQGVPSQAITITVT